MQALPSGSKIILNDDAVEPRIVIPYPSELWKRMPIILFLSFWLCGWLFGEVMAFNQLLNGGANLFLIGWLGGWTVGGCAAMYALYRMWLPPIAETFTLSESTLSYDSGRPAFQQMSYYGQKDYWKKIFPKRKQVEFEPHELQTLQLREFSEGNRLTIDRGHERIDLAEEATDIEREWLYDVLKGRYFPAS